MRKLGAMLEKCLDDSDSAWEKKRAMARFSSARTLLYLMFASLPDHCREHFDLLVRVATDYPTRAERCTALRMLGFAGDIVPPEFRSVLPAELTDSQETWLRKRARLALDVLVSAVADEDEAVSRTALHGIARLKHPDTPVGVLARIIADPGRPLASRIACAWAFASGSDSVPADARRQCHTVLRQVLASPPGEVEPSDLRAALELIVEYHDDRDTWLIQPLSTHASLRMRIATVQSLINLMTPSTLRVLRVLAVSEPDEDLRRLARQGLAFSAEAQGR